MRTKEIKYSSNWKYPKSMSRWQALRPIDGFPVASGHHTMTGEAPQEPIVQTGDTFTVLELARYMPGYVLILINDGRRALIWDKVWVWPNMRQSIVEGETYKRVLKKIK